MEAAGATTPRGDDFSRIFDCKTPQQERREPVCPGAPKVDRTKIRTKNCGGISYVKVGIPLKAIFDGIEHDAFKEVVYAVPSKLVFD